MENRKLTVLCAARLHVNQLERHLELLDRLDLVERILVVRHAPMSNRLKKVESVVFPDRGKALNMVTMARTVRATLRREPVDWVLGFNPVPWGGMAAFGAWGLDVNICLSFIGKDFKDIVKPWAKPFWSAVRHAGLVTVTGERMRRGLVERGLPAARIRILPHSVDTGRFSPGDREIDYDVIAVGQLIPRKRMNVLVSAVAKLRDKGLSIRLGILGAGPERENLEAQIGQLKLERQVSLLGYRDDVESVLKRSRIFALVSSWEGVPFAMIEAMASGLIPVVTDVGTIADVVKNGENGLIVPVGDVMATADALGRLIEDNHFSDRLRNEALKVRETLSLEAGVEFWRQALSAAPAASHSR